MNRFLLYSNGWTNPQKTKKESILVDSGCLFIEFSWSLGFNILGFEGLVGVFGG